mmetsp:Transcript_7918/g.15862  ORF Transcript_7918/g.15862 Transcript_7918/m.15862 type:complete len:492 (+) Transcript_7918:63-1538(+)|eukprot:CAMPEP_0119057378 /NCGR_PEP_ID=MMETSP1178-20130426/1843_1 /TAXON_ID=33656 /ORGANISM="unid sp, Strain CCMP2000" /LENGTH=491 /DNA_ID=CAMNT_0007038203 /DNA_START=63 /DNA_END=1538 /DNA_ORIENTATION=-
MTLTVVVGSSGSGKTTFLNHVHDLHKCTYIRQYHTLRPYIPVHKVPDFDPTQLPYWKLYTEKKLEGGGKNLSYDPNVKIGGTMAGEFTAGLSGGQRKMMVFELVRQRTSTQSDLLICLDEPFAGVTDNFVPFITARLHEMKLKHNLVLVTNDHIEELTKMADNIITVSAIDRSKVLVDGKSHEREYVLHALAKGEGFERKVGTRDLAFFVKTEVLSSPQVLVSLIFTAVSMLLFLVSFWDSKPGQEALVLVGLQILAFFCVNPYLIGLTDWRTIVVEESDALMHSSVQSMLALKVVVTLALLTFVSAVTYGFLIVVLDTPITNDAGMWVSMYFDLASLTLPFICFGLYSNLPLQIVQTVASMPFLFMIFFSGTFSPGGGVEGLKGLRFLFSRFYLWCRLPEDVSSLLEGCPAKDELAGYAILSGILGLFLFLVLQLVRTLISRARAKDDKAKHEEIAKLPEYQQIQMELYKNAQNASGRALSGKNLLAVQP